MEIRKIGEFSLTWGESLLWDEIKERLYFVDCSTNKLHWLENGELPLYTVALPSMPTGIGLSDDDRLVIALDEGLFLFNPNRESLELLSNYPPQIGKRANDLVIDSRGNIVTGSLKEQGKGSYWWFSSKAGWKELDSGISNTNGPVTFSTQKGNTLVIADTPAKKLYAYDYNPIEGIASARRVYADTAEIAGSPDGACLTEDGEVLSCILGPGLIAHYTDEGLFDTYEAGSEQPSDITFGGRNLERLFVTSIKVEFGHGKPMSNLAGSLVEIKNTGLIGVKENKFRTGT
ncbi:MAG: hypothetical protein COB20_11085 [SAR86 cluster bacterium]|uniref:SMP-30/Gluconolactonase/LRE-like region domain-containing protein n=1 Tax=SAR86 cluster bacterium TaxID=2030880 RepID=A0A2A4X0K1_9GAMM|nr:MAG: hypothetical protein COB20_11085 [SAR86 cluster bacterium]